MLFRSPSFTARLCIAAAALVALSSAQASLVGSTVQCSAGSTSPPPVFCSASSAVVGSGPEFQLNYNNGSGPRALLDIDLDATSITLTAKVGIQFAGGDYLSLSDLYDSSDPSAVLVFSGYATQNVVGFGPNKLAFSDHALSFDLGGVRFNAVGATAKINFTFRSVQVDPNAVPEPGSLALVGLALTGLALSRKAAAKQPA